MRTGHVLVVGEFDPPLSFHVRCINKFLEEGPVCVGVNEGVNAALPVITRMDFVEKIYWDKDVKVIRLPPLEVTERSSIIDLHQTEAKSLSIQQIKAHLESENDAWKLSIPKGIEQELEAILT